MKRLLLVGALLALTACMPHQVDSRNGRSLHCAADGKGLTICTVTGPMVSAKLSLFGFNLRLYDSRCKTVDAQVDCALGIIDQDLPKTVISAGDVKVTKLAYQETPTGPVLELDSTP